MRASVIITTYNQPEWLDKVLYGYTLQEHQDFELIVADDGSDERTLKVIGTYQQLLSLQHVWQEDEGFQKSRIMNKAIVASTTDYLIFSDGDCIPRKDFVSVHVKKAKKGHFLSGGYFKLPAETSKIIQKEDIRNGNAFDKSWLYAHGLEKTYKTLKLTAQGRFAEFMNWITPAKSPWNGHNSSGWKQDILNVNGFDERMQYGGQDRELGERLVNSGIKSIQIRYSAICIHLDHARPYRTTNSIEKNKHIRKITKRNNITWTAYGIDKQHKKDQLSTSV